ncbi:MAG: hypothetical protein U7127_28115 [Phormidium sp.]
MESKLLTKIAFGLLAGTTFSILVLPETTLAQNLNTDPSQEFQKDGDPLTGGTGQSFSVFDLIHRSNLGLNRSMEDVTTEQKENLDEAATQFRLRQRERLQIPDRLIDRLNPNTPTENTTTQ